MNYPEWGLWPPACLSPRPGHHCSLLTWAGAGLQVARSVFHPHSLAVLAPVGRGGVAALPAGQLYSPTTGARARAVGLPFGPGAIHLWERVCYTPAEVGVPHSWVWGSQLSLQKNNTGTASTVPSHQNEIHFVSPGKKWQANISVHRADTTLQRIN